MAEQKNKSKEQQTIVEHQNIELKWMIYDLDSHTDAPGSVAEAGWHKALAFVQYHADLTQAEHGTEQFLITRIFVPSYSRWEKII